MQLFDIDLSYFHLTAHFQKETAETSYSEIRYYNTTAVVRDNDRPFFRGDKDIDLFSEHPRVLQTRMHPEDEKELDLFFVWQITAHYSK